MQYEKSATFCPKVVATFTCFFPLQTLEASGAESSAKAFETVVFEEADIVLALKFKQNNISTF
jgi:hypothetical protein